MAGPDFASRLNAVPEGWTKAMGLSIDTATAEEVTCSFRVGPQHLQAFGIVHGGVHCGVVETLASIGAAINALPHGRHVVGLENSTSFIRAVRTGTRLHAAARPLTRGRRSQVWIVDIKDEEEKLVATGRVRLIALDVDAALAGESVKTPLEE